MKTMKMLAMLFSVITLINSGTPAVGTSEAPRSPVNLGISDKASQRFNALVAHWELDEASGTIAFDSVGRHDGVLYGGPVWQPTTGKIGGSLEFDGVDDYVDTGYAEDLATWTVSAWVNSPAAPSGRAPTGPVHRGGTTR